LEIRPPAEHRAKAINNSWRGGIRPGRGKPALLVTAIDRDLSGSIRDVFERSYLV
jgi:hypothetical protein